MGCQAASSRGVSRCVAFGSSAVRADAESREVSAPGFGAGRISAPFIGGTARTRGAGSDWRTSPVFSACRAAKACRNRSRSRFAVASSSVRLAISERRPATVWRRSLRSLATARSASCAAADGVESVRPVTSRALESMSTRRCWAASAARRLAFSARRKAVSLSSCSRLISASSSDASIGSKTHSTVPNAIRQSCRKWKSATGAPSTKVRFVDSRSRNR